MGKRAPGLYQPPAAALTRRLDVESGSIEAFLVTAIERYAELVKLAGIQPE